MRISLNWLKEYVDIDLSVDELAHQLTMLGLEIEAIDRPGQGITKVVVGQIESIEPHPDADKLVVCKTNVGQPKPLQIVCGAKNMKVGDKVPTALLGATLAGGFEIKPRKMRGVDSQGMMCAADELGLGDDHSGLLILDPAETIGADALPILGLNDVILEIEVTPNRGDWAGMIGVAREIAALTNSHVRLPDVTLDESTQPVAELSSVTIEAPDLCPRYTGRVITDAKIAPSPAWLRKKLVSAGQRPINNVVDVTNYVLMETGHPLHAFDYGKLTENRIVVRQAKHDETIETLDGQSRKLAQDMLVIADAAVPVAVAGVMGGADSEVGDTTTTIFLESAYFHPPSIRRTSRTLGLVTEASQRFQRGADPEMAIWALDRAADLIQKVTGGKLAQGRLDEYPNPLPVKNIELRYARTDLLLGTTVAPETQRDCLSKLDFAVHENGDASCLVTVPTWRHDVTQEADLIEEIARLVGYQNIDMTLPAVRQSEKVFAPLERAIRQLRNYLVGLGLTELLNMSFGCVEDTRKSAIGPEYEDMVALANPLSENHACLRTSLIPGILQTTSLNLRRGTHNVLAFEIGPIYKPIADQELPQQDIHLALVLAGQPGKKHWSLPERRLDFYDIKGYTETLLDHLDVSCTFSPDGPPMLEPGQSAAIKRNDVAIGSLGCISSDVLEAFDIDQPVYILDLDLSRLLRTTKPANQFEQPPTFPPSLRDLALLVDSDVQAGALLAAAQRAAGKILRDIAIFDVYTGKQVPQGKKSIALSLTFQSTERTLTDKETQKSCDRIVKALNQEFQAELR